MRAFGKVAFMAVMCLAVMSRCLAGPRFGGGRQEGRSTFGRVVEGVGGTAFTVAGAGLASSGVAALGGAIASASTSLAMGGTAAGFLGAVGMGAGIVALGAGVALVGIHCITDATGIWTFEDSRKLFDKGCKKLADWLTGKKSATDFDDAGLMPASMIDPLPELDSMQEFISRTENGSAHSVKVMDAETLKRIDPEAYEALSGASGASASESSSERVKKMREKRKELRERLAAMDVDDGSQDWCRCDEPGCFVVEDRKDGKSAATVSFGCSKCGKINREYARLALKWEKKMLRQGIHGEWIGENAEANAHKAAGVGQ